MDELVNTVMAKQLQIKYTYAHLHMIDMHAALNMIAASCLFDLYFHDSRDDPNFEVHREREITGSRGGIIRCQSPYLP